MSQQIHIRTNFSSTDEAKLAKDYLESVGIDHVSLNGSTIDIHADDEQAIASYEIVKGLGGDVEEDSGLAIAMENQYGITQDDNELAAEPETDIIDADSYIDPNLGYGDFELIEPYTLHTYQKLMDTNPS